MNQRQRFEARHFKNIKVLTRNQAESSHNAPNEQTIKKTITNNQITQSQQQIPHISQNKSQGNIHKRLKLKDYLHLNGIEKKNRSKSKISNNSSAKSKTQGNQSHSFPSSKHEMITLDLQTKVELKKSPQSNYTNMLKQQILDRITQQKKKLTDLQSYLSKDFKEKDKPTQTFVFLFHIYNQLNEIHNINNEVGTAAVKYSKEENTTKGKLLKKVTYHWEDDGELDSPAKMKKPSKTNFDLETILKMSK